MISGYLGKSDVFDRARAAWTLQPSSSHRPCSMPQALTPWRKSLPGVAPVQRSFSKVTWPLTMIHL